MIERLQRVALREVWKHEAYNFTQWLEENIDVLNDVTDLNLVNIEREKKTESTFSVDLFAEDADGSKVIIENQLERSDHDHLGNLITYLTAMQAQKAVWIVAHPRPEHVAAINWLNESTNADFYLLNIEAVCIRKSPPAPLLTVIVGPSEEGKSLGRNKQAMTEQQDLIKNWWTKLQDQPKAVHHKHITLSKYNWLGVASGVSGVGFNYIVRQSYSGVEVYIDRGKGRAPENLALFLHLQAQKSTIDSKFGFPLEWLQLEGKRACLIKSSIEGGYRNNPASWPSIHEKLADAMHRLHDAVSPHLKTNKFKEVLNNIPTAAEPNS